MPETRPVAVLLDIEGTIAPIAFVHEVLFPFARARMPALLREQAANPAVAVELEAVRAAAPGQDPLSVLLGWMDANAKPTPLKALQGIIWSKGYADLSLRSILYPEVGPALRRWQAARRKLFVYSSGSVEAQRMILMHSTSGDLSGLFEGFFDTRTGPKREAKSYRAITRAAGLPPASILFLSDAETELDAAATAGLAACQVVRPADRTVASARHVTAADLTAVECHYALAEPP